MKTTSKTRMITRLMVGAVLATASLTGCAIHPLNHDTTGSTKRMFVGFTTGAEELVEIQAQTADGAWETLDRVMTGDTVYPGYASIRYYIWSSNINIPKRYWVNQGYFEAAYYHFARVRILDSSGRTLFTYDKEPSTVEMLTENPIDLWREKGNSGDILYLWLKSENPNPF